MFFALGLLGAGLLLLMSAAATANLGLRTRSLHDVSEHLERSGRDGELRWLTNVRDELTLATATLRTFASLALVLDVVALCENQQLQGAQRNVTAFVAAAILIVIFGIAVPSAFAKYAAGAVIAATLPALKLLRVIALPLLKGLEAVDAVMRRLLGAPAPTPESEADELEKEILRVVSEGELQGAVDETEKEMIRSVIEFGDTDVEQIMTPRTEISAIEKGGTLEEVIRVITESGHSRIPVYEETIDNICGVLYAKDMLRITDAGEFDITRTMRTVPYIPDTKPVSELLQELKERQIHIAIVLDEYGGTCGLVTIEDILEELVGEIADEYEPHEPAPIKRIDDDTVDVDARMRLDELNDQLSIALPEHDDYETIGGYVFSAMGRIPRVGEHCRHENVRISVIAAEPRRINRLRLHVQSSKSEQPAPNEPD